MCGRFAFFMDTGEAQQRFDARPAAPLRPRYNIAPDSDIYTITNEHDDVIGEQHWGLLPGWVDDPEDSPRPINARAETIAEKPYFREAFAERRCLVPANGFFEWQAGGRYKTPYFVTRDDREPFAMAGVWESWSTNGETVESVAIVTTDANDVVDDIHDRMPVILAPDEERTWLEGDDPDELLALLDPLPAGRTAATEVSTRVNDPANDDPNVLLPADGEQSGLGDYTD